MTLFHVERQKSKPSWCLEIAYHSSINKFVRLSFPWCKIKIPVFRPRWFINIFLLSPTECITAKDRVKPSFCPTGFLILSCVHTNTMAKELGDDHNANLHTFLQRVVTETVPCFHTTSHHLIIFKALVRYISFIAPQGHEIHCPCPRPM